MSTSSRRHLPSSRPNSTAWPRPSTQHAHALRQMATCHILSARQTQSWTSTAGRTMHSQHSMHSQHMSIEWRTNDAVVREDNAFLICPVFLAGFSDEAAVANPVRKSLAKVKSDIAMYFLTSWFCSAILGGRLCCSPASPPCAAQER